MKLLRWTLAGASAYVIYKYTIGNKAQGEEVFVKPGSDEEGVLSPERESATAPAKRTRARKSKGI